MKLGVSACLIGTQCRYDGIGANDKFVIDVLQNISKQFLIVLKL